MSKRMGRPPGITPDGQRIRRLRIEHGLSLRELAAQIGRHRGTLQLIETQNRTASEVLVHRIARTLGVPAAEIIADDDEDEQELAS